MSAIPMPKRSKSQEIGEAVLPRWQQHLDEEGYLFRAEVPDYGLDGEVEEFTDGAATGLRYKAQLKGTCKTNLKKAMSLHVPFSQANYWRAHSLPVLLVLYHKPTDQFYVRWFHTFDPHDGGVGKTGLTFRWRDEDEWLPGRARSLAAEARAYLAIRAAQIPLPFAFGVEVTDDAHGLNATEVLIALRSAAQLRPDVVRILDRAPAAGEGRLIVRTDRLVADLGGVMTATLHLTEESTIGDVHQVATDLLMLAGAAFERVGQDDLASRLAYSYLPRSTLLGEAGASWALSGAMGRARKVREALDLADEIDALPNDSGEDPGIWFTLPVLYHASSLSAAERERAVEVLQARIDRRHERNDPLGEARASVNLGNFFRRRAEPVIAIELYERALVCDPGYGDRAHYWEEKAGVLFGARRYDEAVQAYKRALDLGSGDHVLALHADALLFAGEYTEARAGFRAFLATKPAGDRDAEYRLKLDLANEIVDDFKIAAQVREIPSEMGAALIEGSEPPTPDEARSVARDAIARDALDHRAWALLSWAALVDEHSGPHGRYWRAVACLREGDVDAWVHAVIFNLELPNGDFVAEMLVTGQRLTGGLLMDALSAFARDKIPNEERGSWLERVDGLFRSIPPSPGGFALRFIEQDGTVEVLGVPGAEDEPDVDVGEE